VKGEVAGFGQSLQGAVAPAQVGYAHREPSAGGDEVQVTLEHCGRIVEVLDEADRDHELVGAGMGLEEVRLTHISLHPGRGQVLAREASALRAVLDTGHGRAEALGIEDQPLRRRAADLQHTFPPTRRRVSGERSRERAVERQRHVRAAGQRHIGPVVLVLPERPLHDVHGRAVHLLSLPVQIASISLASTANAGPVRDTELHDRCRENAS